MKREPRLALVVAATALVACGLGARPAPDPRAAVSSDLVWPEPPARARIRLVRTLARPADVEGPPSLWRRVIGIFAGRDDEGFVRPTGVAVGGKLVYVADAGLPALWIIDLEEGRIRRIGAAGAERFVSPVAVALGPGGRVYLADSARARIFVLDPEGRPVGAISQPGMLRPAGVACDRARDRLYVADSAAHRVWIFRGDGAAAGAFGRHGAAGGELNFPTHVAVDRDGTVSVTDALNYRIERFGPDGAFLGAIGEHGDASGDLAAPKGVALDSAGHLYVVDALFDAVQIFDREGRYLLAFGGRGTAPGQFWLPTGLAIDGRDRIYVADSYNQRVQVFEYLGGDGDG